MPSSLLRTLSRILPRPEIRHSKAAHYYNTLWRASGRHFNVKTQDTSETKACDSIGRKAPTYVDTYIMLPATPLEV